MYYKSSFAARIVDSRLWIYIIEFRRESIQVLWINLKTGWISIVLNFVCTEEVVPKTQKMLVCLLNSAHRLKVVICFIKFVKQISCIILEPIEFSHKAKCSTELNRSKQASFDSQQTSIWSSKRLNSSSFSI